MKYSTKGTPIIYLLTYKLDHLKITLNYVSLCDYIYSMYIYKDNKYFLYTKKRGQENRPGRLDVHFLYIRKWVL